MTARLLAACVVLLMAPAAAGAQIITWPSESPPRPLGARDVRFPPYHLQTLPNGLRVVAVLHHEQPIVSLRMLVRAGAAMNPRDQLGLADLVASLLTQGTTKRSATELNDEIDYLGAGLGAGAGTDLSFVNMIVMKDSFETGLRTLAEVVRQPAFAPEEIDRQRQQMLSALKVSLEDPEFVADAVFRRLVFGFHPYAWPQSGTPEMLAAITRADLTAFHQRYFVPNNAILAIVGDVTAEEAFEGVKQVFGDWERGEVPPPAVTPPPEPTRRVVVVNKPDAVQTEVRAGHIGIPRNHADYTPMDLATRILGGEGANRLHQVLRTERGLTYGAQAELLALSGTGALEATTNTRSDATAEVLRLMVDEFWRLQRDRVGDRELQEAKNYLAGSFPLTIETADAIATQVLNVLFYGLPVEQLQTFRERINAVTVDEVQRVARSYLRPDRLSIVLVGNADAFAPQLRRLGFTTFDRIEMSDLDLTSANFRRGGQARQAGGAPARLEERLATGGLAQYQQSSAIRPQAGPEAKALLDKVITAKGGLETLRGIKSITARTRADVPPAVAELATGRGRGSAPVAVETVTYLEYPNRVHIESKLPDATVVQVYDGTRAWVKDPNGVHEVPARMIDELRLGLRRDTIAALLAAVDGRLRARVLPDVKVEGGKLHHALELSAPDLDPMVLYIDPATHLIARQTYVAGASGQPLVEEMFSDYQAIDGVQIAFTAAIRRGQQTVLERKVTEIRINAPLDPDLFTRPAN